MRCQSCDGQGFIIVGAGVPCVPCQDCQGSGVAYCCDDAGNRCNAVNEAASLPTSESHGNSRTGPHTDPPQSRPSTGKCST